MYGSPHKNGYTKKALNSVISELNAEYEFEFVDSFTENITPCNDCGFCKKINKCIFSDFDKIDKSLRGCHLIIIATPVYNASFPAPLKAIIDRSQLYFNMKTKLKINPFNQPKKAILVATCGSNNSHYKELLLNQLKLFFVLINAKLCKTVFVDNTDKSLN